MQSTLTRRDLGRLLARIRVSRSLSITELHNLANEEIARKMMRPPFSWYRLHEYDVPAGKLPRYVLEHQDEDYTKPKANVWEVLVTLEPCDVESDYLCIRLEK